MATTAVVVTGASTGIGKACALRFARLGYHVFAGVRKFADGEALVGQAPGGLTPITLDVTSPESIQAAVKTVGPEPLAALINNAGIAVSGPLELVPLELWRRQFEVNVFGQVAVTQAFLPALRLARGRIVNVGSIAGRGAVPLASPYSSSKFALEAITDALRMELKPWGISVSIIEPGAVRTPIWDKTLREVDEQVRTIPPDKYALYAETIEKMRAVAAMAAQSAVPVEEVVKAVEHAVTSKSAKTRYLVGSEAKVRVLLNVLPDRVRDSLILKRINSIRTQSY